MAEKRDMVQIDSLEKVFRRRQGARARPQGRFA